ncbi:major capsid protein [Kitasatospora sp. NPDC056076]|uniref:major capsid protein n=1 Tax=Kitasatospora sp. NPDC056076 TaxID=3345703 RepID=UPI0035DDD7DA
MELDDILEVISIATADEMSAAIQNAVRSAADNGADMMALESDAVMRFRTLQAQIEEGGSLSQEQLTALEVLVDVVEALRSYNLAALAAAEAARERLALLSGRVEARFQEEEPGEELAEDGDEDDGGELAAEEGEELAKRRPPMDEADDEAEDAAEEPKGKKAPSKAASSGTVAMPSRKAAIPLNMMRSTKATPAARRGLAFGSPDERSMRYTVSAADVPGFSSRQTITDMDQLGMLVKQRVQGMVRSANSARAGIATITRHASPRYTVNTEMDLDRIIEHVTDEAQLSGGSLVAAAGGTGGLPRGSVWCAPFETLWDLCPDESGDDGFIDLPTVTTKRAGVRFPQGFDFSGLWGGLGFYQTVDGKSNLPTPPPVNGVGKLGTDKKCCVEIPCPDWTDCEVELIGLCIRNKILMERAWPEWTREFTKRVLKAHRRKINAWLIAKIEAIAGTKQSFVVGPATGGSLNVTPGTHGPGATESILSIIELLVENYRYRYRLPRNKTLELIAPYWLLGFMRADLSKKLGNSPSRLSVTDQMITNFLSQRGVRVQFVYDWQDAFSATGSHEWCVPGSDVEIPLTLDPAKIGKGFGNPAGLKEWPDTVKLLLYPAGSVFRLQQDVITLDGIYDHASLMENKMTSLFTEEGVNVCHRCYDPLLIEISGLCPGGLSGGTGYSSCVAPTPPPPSGSGASADTPQLAASKK